MQLIYLWEILKENEAEFKKECSKILSDNLVHLISELKGLYNSGYYNEVEYEKMISMIERDYKKIIEYFKIGNIREYKPDNKHKSKTAKQLFNYLKNKNKDIESIKAYELYMLFSKFDHLGILSLTFQHNDNLFEMILNSIRILLKGNELIYSLLQKKEQSEEIGIVINSINQLKY